MSSIQRLRVLVNERLSAAAEEIFEAVQRTIAGYEEEILLSKREIRRQHRMLQTVFKPEIKINKLPDQPQLALSVWDEDFPSDQQQHQEEEEEEGGGQCEPDWTAALEEEPPQTEQNLEDPSGPHEKTQLQELGEDNTISIIFTPPYVKNELDQLQSGHRSPKAEGGDPLPGTSAELDQTKVEEDDDDGESSSCSATDESDEEWRGSDGSQSDDSDVKDTWKKQKEPRLPTAPKLHPTKKNKSRICCKLCGKAFHATVSLVNHMEIHPKDVCGVCGE
ncbi:hypothetical protein INR49_017931, partial [Caranx melampygus]